MTSGPQKAYHITSHAPVPISIGLLGKYSYDGASQQSFDFKHVIYVVEQTPRSEDVNSTGKEGRSDAEGYLHVSSLEATHSIPSTVSNKQHNNYLWCTLRAFMSYSGNVTRHAVSLICAIAAAKTSHERAALKE